MTFNLRTAAAYVFLLGVTLVLVSPFCRDLTWADLDPIFFWHGFSNLPLPALFMTKSYLIPQHTQWVAVIAGALAALMVNITFLCVVAKLFLWIKGK